MNTAATSSRVDRISLLIKKLPVQQQNALEKQLNLLVLKNEALRLKNSVIKNTTSMKEIVEEVRKVRNGD